MDLSSKTVTLPSAITDTITNKLPLAGGTLTGDLIINTSSNGILKLQEGGVDKGYIGAGGGGLYIKNLAGDVIFRNSSDADTIRIKDSGNVGIGTSSPQPFAKLEVAGSAGAQTGANQAFYVRASTATANEGVGIRLSAASGSHEAIGIIGMVNNATGNAGSMTFHTYNLGATIDEQMRIDNTGNVGIGTTSPTQKLEVTGNILAKNSGNPYIAVLSTGAGNNPFVRIQADTNYWDLQSLFSNADDELDFRYNGTSKMMITSAGNVGIGTTSPSYPLHISGTGHKRLKIEKTDAGGDADLQISSPNDSTGWVLFHDNNSGNNSGVIKYVHSTNNMHFRTNDVDDRLVISSGGNVGIGTSGPNESLHIYRASGDASFRLQSATQQLRIDQNSIRTTTSSAVGMFTNNNSSNGFRIENDGRMIIGDTSGQTNVKLTVKGNVKMGSAANSSWANTVNDVGGLDVIVGSGSHALQLWDDNSQGQPRFEVERAGKVTMGTTMHLHEARYSGAFNVSGSSQDYNLMMPSFYSSGSVNLTYRHCFNINSSSFHVLFEGGGGNTIFTTWAHIQGEHYRDMSVQTHTLYYSDLKIKIVQDNSASKSVWVAGNTYQNNVYSLRWRVYPTQASVITMNPSSGQSAWYHVHHATGGIEHSSNASMASGTGPSVW